MRIALVTTQTVASKTYPLGLVQIATYLKEKGIEEVRIIDANHENIIEETVKYNPEIIGITSMTTNYGDAIQFAEDIKKELSAITIIGGVHISTLPESMRDCFDLGIIGEGEETLLELIRLLEKDKELKKNKLKKIAGIIYRDKGKIIKTKERKPLELDSLPFPDLSLINKKYFEKMKFQGVNNFVRRGILITSRGCPYKCRFCSTAHFWGRTRFHSPEYVARLMKHLIEEYDIGFFEIVDDLFTVSVKRLKDIKKEMDKLKLLQKIEGMECQPRANLITDELCEN